MNIDILKPLHSNKEISELWIKKIMKMIDNKELKKYEFSNYGGRFTYKVNKFIIKKLKENKNILFTLNNYYYNVTCLHYFIYKDYIVTEYIEGITLNKIQNLRIINNTKNVLINYINSLIKNYGILAFDLHGQNIIIQNNSTPKVIDIDCFEFYEAIEWKEVTGLENLRQQCLEVLNEALGV